MLDFKWETNLPRLPDDFTPLTQQWAAYMAESVAENFAVGGRPYIWQPLKFGGPSHLLRGGALLGSQVQDFGVDFAELRMGAGLPYARIHHYGGTINHPGTSNGWGRGITVPPHTITMPARPYMLFQQEDIEKITQTFSDFIFTFMENNREVKSYG